MAKKKVLVVDDDPVIVEGLKIILAQNGYGVTDASTGREALEKVFDEMPDIVLLDIMLPDITGYEVCSAMRINKATRDIIVIMLTAKSMGEDVEKALEVKADWYIAKPFDHKYLLKKMGSLLAKKEQGGGAPGGRKKVLVIEDEDKIIEALKIRLESAGYNAVIASDGREGWEKVLSEKPDLVILDVIMPEIDGCDVCRMIKGNKDTKHIPVIMLTAKSKLGDMEEGLNAGADSYFTKPYKWDRLLAGIRKYI